MTTHTPQPNSKVDGGRQRGQVAAAHVAVAVAAADRSQAMAKAYLVIIRQRIIGVRWGSPGRRCGVDDDDAEVAPSREWG